MAANTPNPAAEPPDGLLAKEAQAGDTHAAGILLQRYRPLAQARAARYFGASLEQEDIVQEGMLALLSAVYAFQPERNVDFRVFAVACVENRLRSVVKENAAPKNSPLNAYIPLDTIEIADDSDPEQKIISDEAASEWFQMFENDLSSLENSVLKYFLKGYSYREIAASLGITEKAADNALQRIRNKAKKQKENL